MADFKIIYLQPECCADPEIGQLWCEDDCPEECEDGVPWTKYIRADVVESELTAALCAGKAVKVK